MSGAEVAKKAPIFRGFFYGAKSFASAEGIC
jgi:hypothetical protein